MNNVLARFLYWLSLGFDTSEYPLAGWKREQRLKRLQHRMGQSYQHWNEDTDFMWISIPGIPFAIAILILIAFVIGTK